jgi:hypothetical protein
LTIIKRIGLELTAILIIRSTRTRNPSANLSGKAIRGAGSSSSKGTTLLSVNALITLFLFFGVPLHQHEKNTKKKDMN